MFKLYINIGQIFALVTLLAPQYALAANAEKCPEFLDHNFKKLHSKEMVNLCESYSGAPMVFVNTASHCGFTGQLGGLETLYKKYSKQGIKVVGFTSNDFNQAAKSEKEAATICFKNFGVTFTMLSPTSVKGKQANPVFKMLAEKSEKPSWNFNKYLVTFEPLKVQRFGSKTKPVDSKLEKALQKVL